MHPICFYIGSKAIYWYGVMVATGFLLAVANWSWLARREGRAPGYGSDLGFWIMFAGIVGARVAYVVANWSEYASDPVTVIRIDLGGLIFYGGFVGGILAVVIFGLLKKERLWALGDLAITGVPLAHAVGRIGCFLNGCCFGKASSCALSITLDGIQRHPTQLYESGANLLIYGALLCVYLRRHRDGGVLALYLLLYPVARFLLEFLRGDPRQHVGPLSSAQIMSLVLFAAGWVLWFAVVRRAREAHA